MSIMEAARNPTAKEPEKMNKILRAFHNMKYRYKMTMILVVASLVPTGILAGYNHVRISNLTEQREIENMNFLLEQTRESIDGQLSTFSSLLNYLTYSPDIEEVIEKKNLDNYEAYEAYTRGADPLLSVPKSYHEAITAIRLFADSVRVEHEYTLLPLRAMDREWWNGMLNEEVRTQWLANRDRKEIVGVRKIFLGQNLDAVLCITLDYDKIFAPFENIITDQTAGMILDERGEEILYFHNHIEGIQTPDGTEVQSSQLTEGENEVQSSQMAEGENEVQSSQMAEGETEVQSSQTAKDDSAVQAKNTAVFWAGSGLDKNYVSATSVSSENGWHYYLYRPQSSISATVRNLLMGEITLIVICLLVILALGTLFSRWFTRPIEQLTANMAEVNEGSRTVTVVSDSEDEVGQLVRTFRRMMDEINRLIHEVYETNLALKEFELKALQAQINPHFLYNSLSMINWMAIRSKQNNISRLTLALSTFYRTALSRGEDMVSVETCIRNIRAYLEIQLEMHDHDFEVVWNIDEGIMEEKLPKLLLQPVVENAIEHGLQEKEEGDKTLILSFLNRDEEIVLIVEDNGCGMTQQEADQLVTYQAVGYGLKNVNDRLGLLYGTDSHLKIYSAPDEGTRVEMRIPKGVKADEE